MNDERPRGGCPEAAVRTAVEAVERAHDILRASPDPLRAALDSAMSCVTGLLVLHDPCRQGQEPDIHALRDILGIARALVVEVSFAVREKYGGKTA
jgi:hypothetical protein